MILILSTGSRGPGSATGFALGKGTNFHTIMMSTVILNIFGEAMVEVIGGFFCDSDWAAIYGHHESCNICDRFRVE